MKPIFDSGANLVGWFDGQHVFDTQMRWVAFQTEGYLFSSANSAWLGQIYKGSINDQNGMPVGWISGSSPKSTLAPIAPLSPLKPLTPLSPLTPLTPLTPLNPLAPLGGWSQQAWQKWWG